MSDSSVKEHADPGSPMDEKQEHHAIPITEAQREGAKVLEVENADYAAALTSSAKLNPLSRASLQVNSCAFVDEI